MQLFFEKKMAIPKIICAVFLGKSLETPVNTGVSEDFAERGGFEPPVQLPVRQFSKLLVSATHPPFRALAKILDCKDTKIF